MVRNSQIYFFDNLSVTVASRSRCFVQSVYSIFVQLSAEEFVQHLLENRFPGEQIEQCHTAFDPALVPASHAPQGLLGIQQRLRKHLKIPGKHRVAPVGKGFLSVPKLIKAVADVLHLCTQQLGEQIVCTASVIFFVGNCLQGLLHGTRMAACEPVHGVAGFSQLVDPEGTGEASVQIHKGIQHNLPVIFSAEAAFVRPVPAVRLELPFEDPALVPFFKAAAEADLGLQISGGNVFYPEILFDHSREILNAALPVDELSADTPVFIHKVYRRILLRAAVRMHSEGDGFCQIHSLGSFRLRFLWD